MLLLMLMTVPSNPPQSVIQTLSLIVLPHLSALEDHSIDLEGPGPGAVAVELAVALDLDSTVLLASAFLPKVSILVHSSSPSPI